MVEIAFFSTRADGVRLVRTCSNAGKKIRKVGTEEFYDEAIDVESSTYEYEETDVPVDAVEEEMEDKV